MSKKGALHARSAFAITLIALVARADATVTQVDGTIIPVTTRLQQALDLYEPPVGSLDAIKDASEFPQIFRPRLSQAVTFKDIRETAGFENSFGWYNVGDDISTPAGRNANLHPVMGCGVPMVSGAGDATHHSGFPSMYVQNAEEPNAINVDFNAELAIGRYKGGFIGFYLITPEDPNNPGNRLAGRSINCGDFKNDPGNPSLSLFGRMYVTQKDLNNDGDFVHHLAYTSKATVDRFYFGFEDLFRGGDNDFDDMAMQIEGLTPPCIPSPEICDGLDNDCDGLVDNADPSLTGVGNACTCDNISLACDNGPRFGQCQTGVTACTAGAITCHGTGTPSAEICDGKDNNCNNQIDENPIDAGGACGNATGACDPGAFVCQNGTLVCQGGTGPTPEQCNGVDDDCNGFTDEGDPGGGGACGSSTGVCTPGTLHCMGGGLVCQGGNQGGPELCNGLDDNCNGVVDDSPTDVGQVCGASNIGECKKGLTICINGGLQCAGEVGPTVERCNGLDDNCNGVVDDNPVDAGQPCGTSIGACDPGVFVCQNGSLVCQGGTGPTSEICNGIDDDCNGLVDDNVPGEGVACGSGTGTCTGATKCINGTMQCVGGGGGGTEVCNGVDDDCDGLVDEGDLCNGGICDNGQCATQCLPGEFPCPPGKKCNAMNYCVDDPCYGVTCPNDPQGNLQSCQDGSCKPLCNTVTCPNGLVCRGSDGACVPDTCEYLPKCAADQLCINGQCVADPCTGVSCPSDQFCRGGMCVTSCQGVQCAASKVCQDGTCVDSGCTVDCGTQVCNPNTHMCQDNACAVVHCPPTEACDPVTGQCVTDPCQGVTCPNGQSCTFGQCGVAPRGTLVTTGGGGGCSTGGDASLGVGLIAVLLLLKRRRLAIIAAASLAVAGCKQNNYCIECETGKDDGGMIGSGGSDAGDAGGMGCDPNQIHPESCNGLDDDCDGTIDETFDLMNDAKNCGACGISCDKAGAQTKCDQGACKILGCFPGYVDKDHDIGGPFNQSDGCEYMCFVSNNGVEACDGLDNDCNGQTDETFNLTNDINNCGACNHRCEFFEATPHCVNSQCRFDPAVDCAAGFHDIDGNQANGCEYQCTPTNGGVEACDVLDNNCNGQVDEGFDFNNDKNNCSRCGFVCQFPHATAHCGNAACFFNPATDCAAGFVDADHQQLNGCEYQCTKTNGGVEICDGIDNDCNGVADDNAIDAGGACAATNPPKGVCVADGVLACSSGHLVCTGETLPTTETCNNRDDDCDGVVDDGVTQICYDGAPGTSGIGVCHTGVATCSAGVFGACQSEVTPSAEQCNGLDDDCNGQVDDGPGGGAITASCYNGPPGTANVGTCKSGTKTCAFGAFGGCVGEVDPRADICGDGLDTDCDGKNDAAEGCQVLDAEVRLDAPGGSLGETNAGTQHSYDVVLARGGVPFGSNVYAAWSQLVGGVTEVYIRKSADGGKTWGTIINVTQNTVATSVKPQIAVAAGNPDRVVVAYQTVAAGVRDIHVNVSTDGGATFGNPSGVLDTTGGDSFHHMVTINGLRCAVVWEELNTATLNRDVMARTSTDGCSTFSAEFKINVGSPATRFAGRPQVGITSAGVVVYAWREQRSNSTRDVFAAAAALGSAPASDIAIDTDAGSDSDFPQLVVNESNAYLVWQDVSTAVNGGADVMFARSTNGGTSWSAARIIDDPNAEVSSSFTPSIAIDPRAAGTADDIIALAWEDRRQGSQVFTSISQDGGATFGTPIRASSEGGDPITGATTVPQIAAAGGGVLAVVYQNQATGANTRPHVFIATSIDTGATWTFTQFALDNGVGPAIAPQVVASMVSAKPSAVAAWADFRTNQTNGDIYVAVSH